MTYTLIGSLRTRAFRVPWMSYGGIWVMWVERAAYRGGC